MRLPTVMMINMIKPNGIPSLITSKKTKGFLIKILVALIATCLMIFSTIPHFPISHFVGQLPTS